MKITIEVTDTTELEKVLVALKTLHVEINHSYPSVTKGDKSIDTQDLFGIWKKKPRTLAEIRSKAWERS